MQFVSHLHRRCAIPALVLTLFSLASPLTRAQEAAPALPSMPAKIDLQDGDTLVFLGDSITHQRLYTQYVEDFFYTRYPDRRINFHNAGIGGARAWDALQRVNRDVLDYNPRYVTILLGMNDGSYQPFNTEIFKTYQRDMTQLVAEIREGGATPILMSPTMFDARAGNESKFRSFFPNQTEVDNWLERWGDLQNGVESSQLASRIRSANPLYIPRNHLVEEALAAASDYGDLAPFESLLEVVQHPFKENPQWARYAEPASADFTADYQTFCGT